MSRPFLTARDEPEASAAAFGPGSKDGYSWAENLRQAVHRHRRPARRVCELAERALDDCVAGKVDVAAATVINVIPLFDRLGDGQLAERLEAALWLGWSELLMDR